MEVTAPRSRFGWRIVVAVALLVGLIAWVQWQVGWTVVLAAWSRVTPFDAAVAIGLAVLGYLARAWRLAAHFGAPLRERPGACLRVMVLHNAMNNLLPMRTGEISFPVLLGREFGIETARAVAALLWLRSLDLLALLLAVAVTLGVARIGAWITVPALAVAVGAPWIAWSLLRRDAAGPHLVARARALLQRGLPADPAMLLRTQAWTLLHWGSKLAAYAWLVARLGGVEPVPAVLASVAGEATSVLPVHGLAGAGTYEAGVVAVLRPLGVPLEPAVQAAVNLHLFLLVLSIVAAAVALAAPHGPRRDGSPA